MNKKIIRYFCGFIDTQQKWLNSMAENGYRLVSTGKLIYEFEECKPQKYSYAVDFVAHKSNQEMQFYKDFLEDVGYRVMVKNANLNWSIGKVKLRPYGEGLGKIATSPGNYNKELLIVEKINDGKPFTLHTTNEDKISYFRYQRNAYLCLVLLVLVLFFMFVLGGSGLTLKSLCILSICVITAIPMMENEIKIRKLKSDKDIVE